MFSSPGDFLSGEKLEALQRCQQEKPVMDIILRNIMFETRFFSSIVRAGAEKPGFYCSVA